MTARSKPVSDDPLSSVLGMIRLSGAVFLDNHFTAPWAVLSSVTPQDYAPYHLNPRQLVGYHLIVEGSAYVALPDSEPVIAKAGDAIIIPRNDPHVMASALDVPLMTVPDSSLPRRDGGVQRCVMGGGGAATREPVPGRHTEVRGARVPHAGDGRGGDVGGRACERGQGLADEEFADLPAEFEQDGEVVLVTAGERVGDHGCGCRLAGRGPDRSAHLGMRGLHDGDHLARVQFGHPVDSSRGDSCHIEAYLSYFCSYGQIWCGLMPPSPTAQRARTPIASDPGRNADPAACADDCSVSDADRVALVRRSQPPRWVLDRSAELFRLLADPTRVALLQGLADGGELCVCDLAELTGTGENAVSQALRLLRTADVVRTRRDGRRVYYRLADAHVKMLVDVTVEHVSHPTDRAQR